MVVMNFQEDVTNVLKYFVILYASCVFSMMLFKIALDRIDLIRIVKTDISNRHDYNYALYRTIYKNYKSLRTSALLTMAKQQLQLKKPAEAKQALDLISLERLNKKQLKSYYFYHAMTLFMLNEEGWHDDLTYCHAIITKQSSLTKEEMDALFDSRQNQNTISYALEQWDQQPVRNEPIITIFAGILLLYTGLFFSIEAFLPTGYSYREYFDVFSSLVIYLSWFVLILYWLIWLIRHILHWKDIQKGSRIILFVIMIMIWIVINLNGALYTFLRISNIDEEIEVDENGLILMRHKQSEGSPLDYSNKAVGPFLRRSLTIDDMFQNMTTSQENFETNDTTESSDDTSESDDSTDTEAVQDPLTPEFMAIYQYLVDAGEIESLDSDEITISYSAKGTPYVILQSDRTGIKRLVYDRVSRNQECDLFVYYLDETINENTQTTILEFYAVNKQSLEVIAGEKTNWSDVSSQDYQDATGEY